MKKEQRQVLDEQEKQLSSLISEKEKLEERQVTLVPVIFQTDAEEQSKTIQGKKVIVCNSPRFFSPKLCKDLSVAR